METTKQMETSELWQPLPGWPRLTLQDRCDSCNAQAFVRFINTSGDLLFCKHHGEKMELGLMSSGFLLASDQRSEINSKPGSGEVEAKPTGAYGLPYSDND